jgi:hypothetical protein
MRAGNCHFLSARKGKGVKWQTVAGSGPNFLDVVLIAVSDDRLSDRARKLSGEQVFRLFENTLVVHFVQRMFMPPISLVTIGFSIIFLKNVEINQVRIQMMRFKVEYIVHMGSALHPRGLVLEKNKAGSEGSGDLCGRQPPGAGHRQWAWSTGQNTFDWMDRYGPFDLLE